MKMMHRKTCAREQQIKLINSVFRLHHHSQELIYKRHTPVVPHRALAPSSLKLASSETASSAFLPIYSGVGFHKHL